MELEVELLEWVSWSFAGAVPQANVPCMHTYIRAWSHCVQLPMGTTYRLSRLAPPSVIQEIGKAYSSRLGRRMALAGGEAYDTALSMHECFDI